ncbi:MAG: T9SS type A sorting domain-containing protein [Ignavibacteria bacterium]|jgi:hypothetical protein
MKNKITFLFIFFIALCFGALEVSAKVTGVSVAYNSGQVLNGVGGSITYIVTISSNNSSGDPTLSMTGVSIPSGATAVFSDGSFSVSSNVVHITSGSGTVTLTITDDGTSPVGKTSGITVTCTSTPNDIESNAFDYEVQENVPVELTSFSADISSGNVILKWNTATEVNNYGFEVHRSVKTDDWEVLGFVEGYGNSNSPKNYSFTDDKLNASGKYLYRLKQIDNDGTYEFFGPLEIDLVLQLAMGLSQNYPNPFNPTTTISFSLPEAGNISLKIFNSLGEEVATLVNGYTESGVHTVNFNADNLPSGLYIYELNTNEVSLTRKMLYLK